MKTCVRLFLNASIFLALMMFSSIPVNAQKSDVALIEARATELTEWIVNHSAFKTATPPPIVFVPQETLTRVFGDNMVRAIYFPRLMLLRDDFELGVSDFVLLHELVHHLQFESGKLTYGKDVCSGLFEREAYELQNKFVRETGIGWEKDALMIMVMEASCHMAAQ